MEIQTLDEERHHKKKLPKNVWHNSKTDRVR